MAYATPDTMLASQAVLASHWNRLVENQIDLKARIEQLALIAPSGVPEYTEFPIGAIVAYYGAVSSLPAGWYVCDGTVKEGVTLPNLQGKFICGIASDEDDSDLMTGGGALVHTHSNPDTSSVAGHHHTASGNTGSTGTSATAGTGTTSVANSGHLHSYSIATNDNAAHSHSVGATQDGSSLPPYAKLYWITRLS